MIPAQRRLDILQLLKAQKSSSIIDLSARYAVSEMTIRRDLKTLEDEGHVKCTHGGAIYMTPPVQVEPAYTLKASVNTAQKTRIARFAAQHFVEDDDTIALEAGTTVGAMVPFLIDKRNLTVVTNGLRTTNLLESHHIDGTMICTGGILRGMSSTFVGPTAEQFFREFHVKKLFLSGIGFTLDAGLTDPQVIDTQVKKAMIAAAEQVILLIDSSKFGVNSLVQVLPIHNITTVITDYSAAPDFLAALRALRITVFTVVE